MIFLIFADVNIKTKIMKTIDSWRKVLTMLMMVAMVVSCGSKSDSEKEDDETSGDPTATLVELTKEIKKGNLSPNELAENFKQALEAQIEFLENDPSEKEMNEFRDAKNDYEEVFREATRNVIPDDVDEKLQEELQKLDEEKRKAMKAFEKRMREKENK